MKVFLPLLLFVVIMTVDVEKFCSSAPTIHTKIVDSMPNFLADKHGFVFNFWNMSYADVPKYNYLALKDVTNYQIINSTEKIQILPTLDYQAVYIHVTEGSVFVKFQMCAEGPSIDGGHATNGWNLVALDFPGLAKISGCIAFESAKSRPYLIIEGTAKLSVWKAHKFCYFSEPGNRTQCQITQIAFTAVGLLGIAAVVYMFLVGGYAQDYIPLFQTRFWNV